jgi:hypothetical protein
VYATTSIARSNAGEESDGRQSLVRRRHVSPRRGVKVGEAYSAAGVPRPGRPRQRPGQHAGFARCNRAFYVGSPSTPAPHAYGLRAARWIAGFAAASTAERFAPAFAPLRPTRLRLRLRLRRARRTPPSPNGLDARHSNHTAIAVSSACRSTSQRRCVEATGPALRDPRARRCSCSCGVDPGAI